MAAFVVIKNGLEVASVRISEDDGCGFHLAWIGGEGGPMILCHLSTREGDELVTWEVPDLEIGDEVTIRIEEFGETYPPGQRRPFERVNRSAGQA